MFSSKPPPPVIASVSVPTYVLKTIGSRHLLLGGGGGASATGVKNELQVHLLSYNNFAKIGGQSSTLLARKTTTVDTKLRASMNMDVVAIGPKDSGQFLVAVGQDDSCFFYESTGFTVNTPECDTDSPAQLGLNLKEIFKVKTDNSTKKSYQLCVRFDRSESTPLRVATGGSDGYVRVWNATDFVSNRDPTVTRKPIVEFVGDGEVSHVDFSLCGSLLASVSNEVAIWSLSSGKKLSSLPETPQIPSSKYKCRDIRFVNLNPNRTFLIAGYNCRVRNSKQNCLLAIWNYDQEKRVFRSYEVHEVDKDAIATMSLSACHNFIAVGTLGGSVHVLDTRQLSHLYSIKEAHKSFVTAVEFLPRRTLDTPAMGRIEQNGGGTAQTFLPGVTSDTFLSLVTSSIDNRLVLHSIPFPPGFSMTTFWLKSAAWLLLFYLVFWIIFLN